jgi:hypothetical protein
MLVMTKYKVFNMMVDVLELWLRDANVKVKDEDWFDLLGRLREVEKQLGE